MTNATFEVVVPFCWHRLPNYEELDALDELEGLDDRLLVPSVEGTELPLTVKRLEKAEDHPEFSMYVGQDSSHRALNTEYFVFSQQLDYSEKEVVDRYSFLDCSDINAIYLYEDEQQECLTKNVTDILLAVHIAKPISLPSKKLFSLIESSTYERLKKELPYITKEIMFRSSHPGVGNELFSEMITEGCKNGWPRITTQNISDVYTWLRAIEGFDVGIPKTRLGRAFSAFSYLMTHARSSVDSSLIWSVMALEALYCKGNFGLKEQLSEKTEILLGKRATHKKDFGAMYNYRSRLIHGNLNMSFRHHNVSTEEQNKLDDDLFNAEAMSLSVLIATFQTMCAENMYEMEFDYQLTQAKR